MKKITALIAATFAASMLSVTAASAAPDVELPNRTAAILDDLRCKKVAENERGTAGKKDLALSCRVKQDAGTQTLYVWRYENVAPVVAGLNARFIPSSTSAWSGEPVEASCFVKKGRHIIVPTDRGASATQWCAYTQRRVGGVIFQGA